MSILILSVLLASSPAARVAAEGWPYAHDDDRCYLTIGDKAPALDVAHWLKGDEITEFEAGHIYVVEFWATWCKWCHSSFPGLADIQSRFKQYDVHVAAISDEKLQTIFEFITSETWNDVTDFAVATDPDLSTQRSYMEAAAIGDIPVAFLVGRDGLIEWIGHPCEIEAPLRAVVDGEWDRDKAKAQFEEKIARSRERYERMKVLKEAYRVKDWDRLLQLFDHAITEDPEPAGLKAQRFVLMIGEMDRPKEGYDYGRKLLGEFWNEAHWLNVLAWYVVDHETVKERDLGFAMKAAERAARLSEFKDARILDTLARVYFELGELDTAIKWQRKAMEHLDPADPLADVIRAAMARYEKAMQERRE